MGSFSWAFHLNGAVGSTLHGVWERPRPGFAFPEREKCPLCSQSSGDEGNRAVAEGEGAHGVEAREARVGDLDVGGSGEKHVAAVQVAMRDAVRVHERESLRHLSRHRTPALLPPHAVAPMHVDGVVQVALRSYMKSSAAPPPPPFSW